MLLEGVVTGVTVGVVGVVGTAGTSGTAGTGGTLGAAGEVLLLVMTAAPASLVKLLLELPPPQPASKAVTSNSKGQASAERWFGLPGACTADVHMVFIKRLRSIRWMGHVSRTSVARRPTGQPGALCKPIVEKQWRPPLRSP